MIRKINNLPKNWSEAHPGPATMQPDEKLRFPRLLTNPPRDKFPHVEKSPAKPSEKYPHTSQVFCT
jgi:hypothetical protein